MSEQMRLDLGTRNYEVSVWTLQDSYLATLKWSGISHRGEIEDPKMTLSDDGTEKFSFSIPMYLWVENDGNLVKRENPIWYTTVLNLDADVIIKNMHKIKVIINKTMGTLEEKIAAGEKVYEFLIVKVTDTHEEDNPTCNVECEGLAFHELGKLGFKIELSSDLFYNRLTKYTEGKVWYDNRHIAHTDEPKETIRYWLNDISLDEYDSEHPENNDVTKWYYLIIMDYSSYSELESGIHRISNIIYDDAYTSSWTDTLNPRAVLPATERLRLVDANESNIYNLTLTIAENFNVFCKYEYEHDDNYCIIGRRVIFFNNFILDLNELVELTYPHSSISIEREYDATDITTKMYVRPEDDESTLTGLISIIDTEANPTKEDYIMNFDYFHKIGTISLELYDAILPYNKLMRKYNEGDGTLLAQFATLNRTPRYMALFEAMNGNVDLYSRPIILDGNNYHTLLTTSYVIDNLTVFITPIPRTAKTMADILTNSQLAEYLASLTELVDAENTLIKLDKISNGGLGLIIHVTDSVMSAADLNTFGNNLHLVSELYETPVNIANASVLNRAVIYNDKIYRYTVAGWVDEDWNSIEGLIDLLEKLIAKEERLSSEIKPKLTIAENSVILATERISDANKYIEPLQVNNRITNTRPSTYMILTDLNGSRYISLNQNHREILFDTIHIYRKYDTKTLSFPVLDTVTIPTPTHLTINWSDACASNAVSTYIKIAKACNLSYTSLAVRTLFESWCTALNDPTLSISIPSVKSKNLVKTKTTGDFYNSIDILNDAIGWVLCATGHASVSKVSSKHFKRYMINHVVFNGIDYHLSKLYHNSDTEEYEVKYQGWNATLAGRLAWRLAMSDGLKLSDITVVLSGSSYNVSAHPYSWIPSTASSLTVTCGSYNVVNWSDGTYSAASLLALWDTYYKTTYECYYDYLQDKFEINLYPNEILHFTGKYDNNNSLIQIVDIPNIVGVSGPVYLTYEYNLSVYWERIKEIWEKKRDIASTEATQYTKERDALEYLIELLKTQILNKLKLKYDSIKEFEALMGPALRESYWLPEDYHNYGDMYTANLGLANFLYTADLNNEEDITAKFIWDDKLFSGEAKAYYDYGINMEPRYYECIDLEAFYNSLSPALRPALINNIDSLAFSFYNDNFNKGTNAKELFMSTDAVGNRQWYYKSEYYVSDELGTHRDIVKVARKEASRRYYRMSSTMSLGFIKNSLGSVKPIILVTGLDELPDSVINFIHQSDTYTNTIYANNLNEISIAPGAQPMMGYYDSDGIYHVLGTVSSNHWILSSTTQNTGYTTVYPRIKINSLQLKRTSVILSCLSPYGDGETDDSNLLTVNEDYYIFNRDTSYYITLKPEVLFKNWGSVVRGTINIIKDIKFTNLAMTPFNLSYMISNGGTYIYLDAIKVMKENSIPKVAYTVKPNLKNLSSTFLYNNIGQIVMINDFELKLDNVFGYISEVQLDLNHPWEDEITIKDYTNKFEDLFSTITAQAEEMKKNQNAILSIGSGVLTPMMTDAIENTVLNLNYANIFLAYLDENFDGRDVVVAEVDRIFNDAMTLLGDSKVALLELGAYNNSSSSSLASMISGIGARLTPTLFTLGENQTIDDIVDYKIGDICLDPITGSRYMAVANYGDGVTPAFKPVFDGSLSAIKGASFEMDADKGTIDLLGENEINIKSGNHLNIMADSEVNILGNLNVNIGGTTINIFSNVFTDAEGGNEYTAPDSIGGINIVSTRYEMGTDVDELPKSTLSGVFIKPENIEMIGSEIKMITGLTRYGTTSEDPDDEEAVWTAITTLNENSMRNEKECVDEGSVISLSGSKGIFIATNTTAGIRLYTGAAVFEEEDALDDDFTVVDGSSFVVESDHLAMGTFADGTLGATISIKPDDMILTVGSIDELTAPLEEGDEERPITIGSVLGMLGVRILTNAIGLAIQTTDENTGDLSFLAITLNNLGVTIGSGVGFDANASTKEDLEDSITTNEGKNGSYVRVASDILAIGSTSNIYFNTNNFKLLSDTFDSENNLAMTSLGKTIFAIGNNLLYVDKNSGYNSETGRIEHVTKTIDVSTQETILNYTPYEDANHNIISPEPLLMLNENGLYVKGSVYATNFILLGDAIDEFDAALADSETIGDIGDRIDEIEATSFEVSYAASSSAETIPNANAWVSDIEDVTLTDETPWLWTRTIITYSNNQTSTLYTLSYKGEDGELGVSISGVEILYLLYSSSTLSLALAEKPSAQVIETGTGSGYWTLSIPEWINDYYYFLRELIFFDDGSIDWTEPHINYGTTYANLNATAASTAATEARLVTEAFNTNGLVTNHWWPSGTGENHTNGRKWDVALISTGNLLIGANGTKDPDDPTRGSGIWIAKSAAFSDGAAVVIDRDGIAMDAASITLKAGTGTSAASAVTIAGNGITIGTNSTLNIGANGFTLDATNIKITNAGEFRLGTASAAKLSFNGSILSVNGSITSSDMLVNAITGASAFSVNTSASNLSAFTLKYNNTDIGGIRYISDTDTSLIPSLSHTSFLNDGVTVVGQASTGTITIQSHNMRLWVKGDTITYSSGYSYTTNGSSIDLSSYIVKVDPALYAHDVYGKYLHTDRYIYFEHSGSEGVIRLHNNKLLYAMSLKSDGDWDWITVKTE